MFERNTASYFRKVEDLLDYENRLSWSFVKNFSGQIHFHLFLNDNIPQR